MVIVVAVVVVNVVVVVVKVVVVVVVVMAVVVIVIVAVVSVVSQDTKGRKIGPQTRMVESQAGGQVAPAGHSTKHECGPCDGDILDGGHGGCGGCHEPG